MNKYFLLVISTLLTLGQIVAQQNVLEGDLSINNSGNLADAAAILDVNSTTKGVVFPRLTTVQRLAIPSPIQACWYTIPTWTSFVTAITQYGFV